MTRYGLLAITPQETMYFAALLLLVFLALVASSFFGWWVSKGRASPCPYSGVPLRSGEELPYESKIKVLRYLYEHQDFENQMFELRKAAVSRTTGRIFPNALTWYGTIHADWSFLKKRYPGHYVSWGSLTEEQKIRLIDKHGSVTEFQTDFSSATPSPRKVEPEFALRKPGPLYVDTNTGILLGWKIVPDTELEVLVVQKPLERYLPGVHKKY